jgi:CHAD domain-containing protein
MPRPRSCDRMTDMSPNRQDEVERKYEVDLETVLPDLDQPDPVSSVRAPDEFQLDAVYFDTVGFDLARRRITLRRRSGGHDAGWHLKLPAGGDTRAELRAPLGRDDTAVPEALHAQVRAIVRDRPLAPVASVSTRRREYALCGADGTVLAVVCDDHVQAQRLGSDDPVQAWREWEVELDRGSPALLDTMEVHLQSAGARPAEVSSKLARTIGELPPMAPARASRKDLARGTVGQLLVEQLAEHTAKLQGHDSGVRAGRAESIHRLRIAARRLRSAMSTYGPLLERDVTDPVRDELRWLGTSLAQARDAQVMREHLSALIAEQPPELVIGSVATRIDDQLSAEYQTGREQALAALDSERYFRLLDALDELVESPPLRPSADKAAKKGATRLLRRDARRLHREVRAITSAEDPEDRAVAFHEARKKAKRLRYAAEGATPVVGKRARSLARSAKKVQETLGIHQDSVIARQRLREYGMQAHLDGDNAFTFGRLHALEQARADSAAVDFAAAWATLRKKDARWFD